MREGFDHLQSEAAADLRIKTVVSKLGKYGQYFESNLAAGLRESELFWVTVFLFWTAFKDDHLPLLVPGPDVIQEFVGGDLDCDFIVNAVFVDGVLDLAWEGQEVRRHAC